MVAPSKICASTEPVLKIVVLRMSAKIGTEASFGAMLILHAPEEVVW